MKYSYTWLQQLLNNPGWLPGAWTPPVGEEVPGLFRERDIVNIMTSNVPAPEEIRDLPVNVGDAVGTTTDTYGQSMLGLPLQRATDDYQFFTEWDFWTHDVNRRALPVPVAREHWIEGGPRVPLVPWQDPPGAWDRHVMLCRDDGTLYETLGANFANSGWQLGQWGVWQEGKLVDGDVATAGMAPASMLAIDYDIATEGVQDIHTVGIVMNDYAKRTGEWARLFGLGDGTKDWAWPFPGARVRLRQDVYLRLVEEHRGNVPVLFLIRCLHHCGAVINDRSGGAYRAKFIVRSDARWGATNLFAKLKLTWADLELVTYAQGTATGDYEVVL